MPKYQKDPSSTVVDPTSSTTSSSAAPKDKKEVAMSVLASENPGGHFTGTVFTALAKNEHNRYAANNQSVAHAVLVRQGGQLLAYQYALPPGTEDGTPTVYPLTDIEEIERYGMMRFKATGHEGKTFYARRFDHARVKVKAAEKEMDDDDAVSVDLAYFSEGEGKEPFWGSSKPVPRTSATLSKEVRRDLAAEEKELPIVIKGGHRMVVDTASVRWREENPTRKPDQNTVMGESARDAYEHYHSERGDELSPELIALLQKAYKANINKVPENQHRPEWLHLYGHSLTPKDKDPQTRDNLGAAGKWANTEMMVLERIAKWFALNRGSETDISIETLFTMLRGSDLVDKIHFEVDLETRERAIKLIQDLDPFKKFPIFRKATDLAQATGIVEALLTGKGPASMHVVKRARMTAPASAALPTLSPAAASIFAPRAEALSRAASGSSSPAAGGAGAKEHVVTAAGASLGERPSRGPAITFSAASTSDVRDKGSFFSGDRTMPKGKVKPSFPTSLSHERSVVQILASFNEHNYDEPWMAPTLLSCSGSGMVFLDKSTGEHYVLTNAHVVSNHSRIQVRLTNDREHKFEAEPVIISYQCDLALLRVKSKLFQKQAKPVEFGDMVALEDEISVVGFPMGGSEVSVTNGVVSRVEVQEYSMSGLDMLQVQVDAAINPGNSGGPVFSNGKVIGVAFQGYDRAQNLGYIIPAPIVDHFLKEAFSGKPYRGFPIIPAEMRCLENKIQRQYYGLSKGQTGLLISKIDPSDAATKLKAHDVLLEIDGYKVSNEGTVDIPGVGNCLSLLHVTHSKFIGDTVRVKVLRRNEETRIAEIHELDVILDQVPLERTIVPQTEYDKAPTYYINSGIVFAPVTRNYLEGAGGDLEELTFVDPELGTYSLAEKPRKEAGQQFVVINTVLDCKATEGYGDYTAQIVAKVNGTTINNLADLIGALETNTAEVHLIELLDKTVIPLKKLSAEQLAQLLKVHHIPYDRSEDLRPAAAGAGVRLDDSDSSDDEEAVVVASASRTVRFADEAVGQKRKAVLPVKRADEDDDDAVVTTASASRKVRFADEVVGQKRRAAPLVVSDDDDDAVAGVESDDDDAVVVSRRRSAVPRAEDRHAEAKHSGSAAKRRRVMREDSDEDEELAAPAIKRRKLDKRDERKEAVAAAARLTPGQQRFMAQLKDMEERYRDEDDDDDVIDWDRLTADGEDSDDVEERSAHSSAARNRHSLFASGRAADGGAGRTPEERFTSGAPRPKMG